MIVISNKIFKDKLLQCWTIAVILFVSLDWFYISVGDDLGYMFTDSTLHSCNGERIDNIIDCIKTQVEHYKSTNGRFIVHFLVCCFLSIVGRIGYIITNGIMFGFLWLMVYIIVFGSCKDNIYKKSVFILFLLLTFLPMPGITMMSLVAFSINYMWSAVLYLLASKWIYEATNKSVFQMKDVLIKCFLLIIIGSFHESYSIALVTSFGLYLLIHRKNIRWQVWLMFCCFTFGALVEIFAPGNFNHLNQGGGLSIESLMRKITLLYNEIIFSPITLFVLLLIIFKIFKIFKKIQLREFFKGDSLIFILSILISLCFACLTFTSIRQLFAPYLFSIILIGRLLTAIDCSKYLSNIASIIFLLSILIIWIGSLIYRYNSFTIFNDSIKIIEKSITSSKKIIELDLSKCNYNKSDIAYTIWGRYDCDPFYDDYLHFMFDGYTKRGYSRILSKNNDKNKIKALLPYSINEIINKFKSNDLVEIKVGNNLKIKTIELDRRYSVARLSKDYKFSLPYHNLSDSRYIKFEMFSTSEYYYYIIPNISDFIWIKSY